MVFVLIYAVREVPDISYGNSGMTEVGNHPLCPPTSLSNLY